MGRGLAVLGLCLAVAGVASAQEGESQDERTEPRLVIRVLENPYDLASFYRSSQGSPSLHGDFGTTGFHDALRGRYPIASFYRQGGGGRYAAFWQSGYGARPRLAPGGSYGQPYCDTIGENGDLYLLAPTFLAPVGPLNGAFFR